MLKKSKSILSFMLIICFTFNFASSAFIMVNASGVIRYDTDQDLYETEIYYIVEDGVGYQVSEDEKDQEGVQRIAVTSVLVFVGGILAGYLIEGILIYTTGYSGGELAAQLVAQIVAFVSAAPWIRNIFVNSEGTSFSGSSGKFSPPALY